MKCIYCGVDIPDKARFCPLCTKQFRCKECDEILLPDAKICISCGHKVSLKSNSSNVNTIEFSETKTTRTFKASFTDAVGGSIGEAFGFILNNKQPNSVTAKMLTSKDAGISVKNNYEIQEVEIIDDDLKALNKVFRNNNGNITLSETHLKAKSKRDASIRLTLLFTYYQSLLGIPEVFRNDLTMIMRDASLEDGNWRYWLVNNNLIGVKDDKVELKAPGREEAKNILNEVLNTEIEDKWKLGTSKAPKKNKKKDENEDHD